MGKDDEIQTTWDHTDDKGWEQVGTWDPDKPEQTEEDE